MRAWIIVLILAVLAAFACADEPDQAYTNVQQLAYTPAKVRLDREVDIRIVQKRQAWYYAVQLVAADGRDHFFQPVSQRVQQAALLLDDGVFVAAGRGGLVRADGDRQHPVGVDRVRAEAAQQRQIVQGAHADAAHNEAGPPPRRPDRVRRERRIMWLIKRNASVIVQQRERGGNR